MIAQDCTNTINDPLSQLPRVRTWRSWFKDGGAMLVTDTKRVTKRVAKIVVLWSARAQQRHILMTLDERALRDIGLSRADALAEYDKPFWR